MQNNLIKVIIFDLDDTLYEERIFVESGFRAVSEYIQKRFRVDKEDFFKVVMNILEREGRGYIFDTALRKYNLYRKKLVDKLVRVYRSHKPGIKPYPGVKSLINSLKKKYKLGLITDGLGYVQRNKVKALGLERFFDFIIYTDDYSKRRSKPSSYSFKKALEYFNISPKEAIYIGDDPYKDFLGAKKLGIQTIRVLQGRYRNVKARRNFRADYNIGKLTEIKSLLRKF